MKPDKKPYYTALFVVAIGAVAVYLNTLGNAFIWDDHVILGAEAIKGLGLSNIVSFFVDRNAYHAPGEIYRPLYLLSFAIDYALYGMVPWGYHLTNVLLHAAASALLFVLYSHIFTAASTVGSAAFSSSSSATFSPGTFSEEESKWGVFSQPIVIASFASALLFALHPVHTDSVAWVKGRDDIMSTLFMTGAFLLYLRPGKSVAYIGSLVLFLCALLSKEMAITLPALLFLYDLCFRPSRLKSIRGYLVYAPYFILVILYMSVRTAVLAQTAQMGYLGGSFAAAMFTMTEVMCAYFKLLLFPVTQSADYLGFPVTRVFSSAVLFYGAIVAVVFAVGALLWFVSRVAAFAVLWFFIAILPVSQLVPVKIQMAERFLYIPSIGPALLFGLALLSVFGYVEKSKRRGAKRERATLFFRIVVAGLVVVALLYGFGTLKRNAVWKSEFTLWEDVLKKYPTSRAYANLGLAYEEAGNIEEAERHYRDALKLEPGYFIALNNLAANYVLLGRLDEAIELYGRALRAKPGNAVIHAGLARAYRYRGQVRESIYEYRRALELDPGLGWAREELNALYRAIGVEGERRQE